MGLSNIQKGVRKVVIKQVLEYLKHKYKCHMIILYGSYANGTNDDRSDIDIMGFSDDVNNCINDNSIINGVELDSWIYNTSDMTNVEDFIHILDGKVLLDEQEKSSTFFNRIQELYDRGPVKMSSNDKEHSVKWLNRMFNRCKKKDLEAYYRHHWLVVESLQIYFDIRGLWYLGSKKSLEWLKEHDLQAYELYALALKGKVGGVEVRNYINHVINV